MPLEIIEVLRPSDQGRTTPFLCRGEDEKLYYVKGRKSGPRSQGAEWMIAHLAQKFGLPVPPFTLAHVSDSLLAESSERYQVLGSGTAFASEAQVGAQWFENAFVGAVSTELRRDVMVFDWWIQNMDRTQDNPNLLWDVGAKKLVVIDHDLAFDDEAFWPTFFRQYHVFNLEWDSVVLNPAVRDMYQERMHDAIAVWESARRSAPTFWLGDVGCGNNAFDHGTALDRLSRYKSDALWSTE